MWICRMGTGSISGISYSLPCWAGKPISEASGSDSRHRSEAGTIRFPVPTAVPAFAGERLRFRVQDEFLNHVAYAFFIVGQCNIIGDFL
jgi:hypothetical protein